MIINKITDMGMINQLKILTEIDLRQAVQLNLETVNCIRQAFVALSGGTVVMPPILSMAIKDFNGEVDVKTAYVPGFENFAIKMSPGFFDNPKLGLPSTTGLMVLFSVQTGLVRAVLLDNGYLTDLRTAAAGALAAQLLSRVDSNQVCIVGAGQQSRLQLAALCLVRPIQAAQVWARNYAKAQALSEELSQKLKIKVRATSDLQHAATTADIIVTTTPSTSPLIQSAWLRSGQHITAMGSDQAHKLELDPNCLAAADLYVPDRRSQTESLGELHHAIQAGFIDANAMFPELGDIAAGKAEGRSTDHCITICDLTGTGVQDTAIANFAFDHAARSDRGVVIEN